MRHPRTPTWLPAALLTLAAAAASPALADRETVVRDESKAFPVDAAGELRLDVPVGEVHVAPAAGDRLEVHLVLRCDERSRRCREKAARISLEPTRSDGGMRLKIAGHDREERRGIHHPEVELSVGVPPALAVMVDMGVGELQVDGVEGDLTIDLGVGEVHVTVPESAVRSVAVDVGVGEAHLSPRPDEAHHSGFLFLGNEIDWRDGSGHSRLAIDVGVGEAHVRLTP